MKLFGSITELVSLIFRKNSQTITVRPNQATTYTAARDVQLPPQDANSILVSENASQTLTNKTLTSPAITTPTGIVSSDVGLGNVDNTSDATKNAATVTLTNKTIDGDDNTIQDLALTSLKTVLGDADEVLVRDAAGAVVSSKLLNINVDAAAAIAATKIADGSVDNTEFQRLGTAGVNAAGNLVTTDGTQTLTNKTISTGSSVLNIPVEVLDSTFIIKDNADTSKQAAFSVGGITAGQQRIITVPDSNLTMVGTDLVQVLTNKDIDGGTASNTSRITLPKNTTINLNGLTRKQGTVIYDTTTNEVKFDNGSTLIALGASSTAVVTGTTNGLATFDFSTLDNTIATKMGLKQYLHGTTYNGGNAPTVSPSTGTVTRGAFIPYQMQSGNWRLKFNVSITGAVNGPTFTVYDVLNTSYDQGISATTITATPDYGSGFALFLNNSTFYVKITGTAAVYVSGDVEIDAKPNWAY